ACALRLDSVVVLTQGRVRFVSPNGRAAVDAEGGRTTLSAVVLRSDLRISEKPRHVVISGPERAATSSASPPTALFNQAVNQDVRTSDYDGMLRAVVTWFVGHASRS